MNKNKIKINDIEHIEKDGVYFIDEDLTVWQKLSRFFAEFKCGWHSGFPLCCILFYIVPWKLILKYAKWHPNTYTFYHRWMERRAPLTDIPDLHMEGEFRNNYFYTTGYKRIVHSGWGMIPCPLHILRRRRGIVKTCFCGAWDPEVKAKVLKEYPELCTKG